MAIQNEPVERRLQLMGEEYFPSNRGYRVQVQYNIAHLGYVVSATTGPLGAKHAYGASMRVDEYQGEFNAEIINRMFIELTRKLHYHVLKVDDTLTRLRVPLEPAVEALLNVTGLEIRSIDMPVLGRVYALVKPNEWVFTVSEEEFPVWNFDQWSESIAMRVRAQESRNG